MIQFKDTDYLYASARIRAMETYMVTKADLVKMTRSSFSEAFRMIQDKGIGDSRSEAEYEEALAEELKKVYDTVEELAGCKEVTALFRHKYDAHNLKSLLKAQKLKDDRSYLLSGLGNVTKEEILRQHREGAYEKLAPAIVKAAQEASVVLAKSGDPQQVDTRLDRAVFTAMTDDVQQLDNDYLDKIVKTQIDIYNIRAFIRVKRMKKSADFLKKILAEGGHLDTERLLSVYNKDFEEFFDLLRTAGPGKELEPAFAAIREGRALSELEKLCDNYLNSVIQEAKRVSFGIEPLVAYLFAKENEIKDIRIVLASLQAGVPPQQIEERLRDTYE